MHASGTFGTVLVIAAVLLFFGLGIAIMVIMDHKARLPGGFTENPFSIAGMHRDHPIIAFLTATILLGIITALVLALLGALADAFGLFQPPAPPALLSRLSEERTAERLRHFHHLPAQDRTALGKKNVCFFCHGDYPHSKEPMVRTLLNMHTQFIDCMTCHVDPRKVPEDRLRFAWLNYSGIAVTGPPYGIDVDPATGMPLETDDWYSKIVAYARTGATETLLEVTADDPRAREFAAVQATLSDRDREAVKQTFHKQVSAKGRFCGRCHTDAAKSYVPLRALGFSERRARELTNPNLVGLVQKYREFYLPNLMKSDHPAAGTEALVGPAPSRPDVDDTLRQNPREWWRRTYDAPAGPAKEKP